MKFPHDDFQFTKGERTGLYFLLAIMALCIIGIYLSNNRKIVRENQYSTIYIDSIYRQRDRVVGENESRPKLSPKNVGNNKKLFSFDPNTLPIDSLKMLPISEKVVNVIAKYRSKGGKFKQTSDLNKIYGIDPYIETLMPYVQIEQDKKYEVKDIKDQTKSIDFKSTKPFSEIDTPTIVQKTTKASDEGLVLEINEVNEYQLQLLKGIGPYYAKKIIVHREELGGFYDKSQYDKLNVTPEILIKLKEHTTVNPNLIRKRNIHYINTDTMSRLPFMNFRKASATVNYVKNHQPLKGRKDLVKIRIFSEAEIDVLLYYFRFD